MIALTLLFAASVSAAVSFTNNGTLPIVSGTTVSATSLSTCANPPPGLNCWSSPAAWHASVIAADVQGGEVSGTYWSYSVAAKEMIRVGPNGKTTCRRAKRSELIPQVRGLYFALCGRHRTVSP